MPVEVNETAILLALGRAITARRDELGLSQRGLATEAGLDRVFLRGIEDGTRKATVITLIRLATALDTTAAALLADC
jgi:transcriptional regulator with XRE-family HTH domain